ncbi:MAG: 3-hydroxyanthranilate 3,4-dioxygenase [Calditrichaeota bacterium]|nr:3-hydroxyanthranilate 3,4-dioxygenase [Calditrichota bacterium]
MSKFAAFNFKKWIEDHRHLLKPPVGNKMIFEDTDDFIVMVVGGPNARKDFHYNEGEEFFYQVEGDINLRVMDGDQVVDIPIREGDIYLLPPKVPHSPQRPANTVGLVIERKRNAGENDGFQWYCEKCGSKLYDEYFKLENIVTQLPPIMERFYQNEANRTCKNCGAVMEPPKKA